MAKKKKAKKQSLSVAAIEIIGLSLIILFIILFFDLGTFSSVINSVVIFLIGDGYKYLYVVVILSSLYLMINKTMSVIDKGKQVGIFLFVFAVVLLLAILNYSKDTLYDQFFNLVSQISNYWSRTNDSFGGGVFGLLLASLFIKLFTKTGAEIIVGLLFVISIILLSKKSIVKLFAEGGKKTHKVASTAVVNVKNASFFDFDKKVSKKELPIDLEEIDDYVDEELELEEIVEEEVLETPEVNELKQLGFKDVEELEMNVHSYSASSYVLPPISLLDNIVTRDLSGEDFEETSTMLINTLKDFGIVATVSAINQGPTVTQFELDLKAGTKLSKIRNLSGELSLALAAKDLRIQAPIPGKNTVGIELANKKSRLVGLKEIISSIPATADKTTFALGKNIMGESIYYSLSKMPHLLVAGSTGSGKSVCINSIIVSILLRAKPDEVKLLMIDPKKVELSGYNGVPHLLSPVVTDPRKASIALKKVVDEMEKRYDLFSDSGVKNIDSYNQKMISANDLDFVMPYIVVIVDELADLMLVASKEVEDSIMRITQMARAAGIHLIVATQRPSTDVITGVIKANIPSRIAFSVSSSIDSRTILDSMGAEKLLGKGDMLFHPAGEVAAMRVQGAFLSDSEVERIVDHTTQQQLAIYDEKMMELDVVAPTSLESEDELYNEVVSFVVEKQKASASLLQRQFRIGYNRASRLIDELEVNGVISPAHGSKPREVLIELVDELE